MSMDKIRPIASRIHHDKQWCTISNMLTVSRIFLAPVMVVAIFWQWWGAAFAVLVLASVTDLLDGYLARLLNEQTYLGTLLDPVADKFFLICSFTALAFFHSPSFYIPTWFVVLVLLREVTILCGTYFVLKKLAYVAVQPTIWGKLTTLFQILFIAWLFICYFFQWVPAKTHSFLLIVLALFSLISFLQYMKIGLSYVGNRVYKDR